MALAVENIELHQVFQEAEKHGAARDVQKAWEDKNKNPDEKTIQLTQLQSYINFYTCSDGKKRESVEPITIV